MEATFYILAGFLLAKLLKPLTKRYKLDYPGSLHTVPRALPQIEAARSWPLIGRGLSGSWPIRAQPEGPLAERPAPGPAAGLEAGIPDLRRGFGFHLEARFEAEDQDLAYLLFFITL